MSTKVVTCLLVFGLIGVTLQTVEAKRPGMRGKAKKSRMVPGNGNAKGETDKDGFPSQLEYTLELEDQEPVELHLVRDKSMKRPHKSIKIKKGGFDNPNYSTTVSFYKDKNGRGAFACTPINPGQVRVECNIVGFVNYQNEDCQVGSDNDEADCTPRDTNGEWKSYEAPDLPPSSASNAQERRKRTPLPGGGYKVVEIAFILDKAFMAPFYARHPDNNNAAEDEAAVYITLFTVEMNIYYQSLKAVSKGALELYVYPAVAVFPEAGADWPHISSYTFGGTNLDTTGSFDGELRAFVNSDFTSEQWDHAMFITGLDLHTADGNGQLTDNLLGYAYVGTVCRTTGYKYSINEFTTYNVAATAVHELGHALDASHDNSKRCPSCKYIMSAYACDVTLENLATYHSFSSCSFKSINSHLNGYPACVVNNGFTAAQFEDAFCLGYLGEQTNTLDRQCQRLTSWNESTACGTITDDEGCYAPYQIKCNTESSTCSDTSVYLRFVWNGTPCGDGKFCYRGQCQSGNELCAPTTCSCCGMKGRRRRNCCRAGDNCSCC